VASRSHSRLRRWLSPPRKFRLTRDGKWFIGATLLLGFAAVNGGINLLFLMFGMMLCLLIANGVMSEASMRRLEVHRRLPHALFAGSPFLMGIRVRNAKSRLATLSLEVEDLAADGKPVDRRCFFLKIPAHRQQETAYRRTLATRGIHRLSGLRLSTRFPFGLLRRSIDVEAPVDLLAYPALVPVTDIALLAKASEYGETQNPARARDGEFHGLRPMRPGDDPHDIHWRSSARRGKPFIREFEKESDRSVVIVLETAIRQDEGPIFEKAVSYAASLALLLLRRGVRVGLQAGASFIPPHTATAGAILRCLALVEATTSTADLGRWQGATLTITPAAGSPRVVASPARGLRRSA